jgi:hypothetical protein
VTRTSKIVVVFAIGLAGVFALMFYRQVVRGRVHEVVLVFPNGFRGTARIRAKQPDGMPLELSENTYTLQFPASGILSIRGELPTLKWHHLQARYSDGNAIPIAGPEQAVTDSEIVLRSLGVSEGGAEDWYAVGTSADAKKGLTDKWGFWPSIKSGSK